MATLKFHVGRKNGEKAMCIATMPKLTQHPSDQKITASVKLPDGQSVDVELDSPRDLALAQAVIQLQHAVRDVAFPQDKDGAVKSKRGASYQE